jgi:hypothetical protein
MAPLSVKAFHPCLPFPLCVRDGGGTLETGDGGPKNRGADSRLVALPCCPGSVGGRRHQGEGGGWDGVVDGFFNNFSSPPPKKKLFLGLPPWPPSHTNLARPYHRRVRRAPAASAARAARGRAAGQVARATCQPSRPVFCGCHQPPQHGPPPKREAPARARACIRTRGVATASATAPSHSFFPSPFLPAPPRAKPRAPETQAAGFVCVAAAAAAATAAPPPPARRGVAAGQACSHASA